MSRGTAQAEALAFGQSLRFTAAVKVTELTDHLMASYARVGGINYLDGKNLSPKSAIVAITADLLRLLFPGYFDSKTIHSSELKMETALLMDSVLGRLEDEFCKSIEYDPPDAAAKSNPRAAASALALGLLAKLPDIRDLLKTDVDAAFDGDPAAKSREEIILSYPFIEAISVQRMAHVLYQEHVALVPRIMTEWAHERTGMDLHPGATIGSHFFIDHGTGTVIGETTRIGNHVKLYHGVTLGAKSTSGGQQLRGQQRHPTLEDYVTIYPGATILGGETVIGAHSTIGGNVFIMDSVAPHSLVVYDGLDMRVLNKLDKKKPDFQI
ncbi:MAG: serine acetyltransferase [Pedosphaera sp.]|nr:serine acetyltransferase [Pedosphaera sp.]MSU43054.1 serine acetyltransferase [Pedosphaera sp.]